MEEYTVKLLAHSVLLSVYESVKPDIVEIAVLRYLKNGRTLAYISDKLSISAELAVAGLKERGILGGDLSFRYENAEDWNAFAKKEYRRGYVFYHTEKMLFYNALVFPCELKVDDNFSLANNLGDGYISEDQVEDMHVIKTFHLSYCPGRIDKKSSVRKLSSSVFEHMDYIYE